MTPHLDLAALDRDLARVRDEMIAGAIEDLGQGHVLRCNACGVATWIPDHAEHYRDGTLDVTRHDEEFQIRHERCGGRR